VVFALRFLFKNSHFVASAGHWPTSGTYQAAADLCPSGGQYARGLCSTLAAHPIDMEALPVFIEYPESSSFGYAFGE